MAISRNTKQKSILENEIKNFSSFFTAEDLLKKTKQKDPKIGIATIYRFLSELTNKRQIHTYTCNRKTLYSLNKQSHCHFTCESCGNTQHIDVKSLDFLKNKIEKINSICHFQIDISGICNSCSNKN